MTCMHMRGMHGQAPWDPGMHVRSYVLASVAAPMLPCLRMYDGVAALAVCCAYPITAHVFKACLNDTCMHGQRQHMQPDTITACVCRTVCNDFMWPCTARFAASAGHACYLRLVMRLMITSFILLWCTRACTAVPTWSTRGCATVHKWVS